MIMNPHVFPWIPVYSYNTYIILYRNFPKKPSFHEFQCIFESYLHSNHSFQWSAINSQSSHKLSRIIKNSHEFLRISMNFLLRPENSFTFPWIPLDILQILICFHSRQFLYEYVFPWIPLHRSFQFLLLPMTKKRTLGKVQIERYLDSFPYTSLSLRCCCSRFCRLVGARGAEGCQFPPKFWRII